MIEQSRQQVAVTVNSAMTALYWNIGKRINDEVLDNQRADYGEQIVRSLSEQLILEYGNGWSEKHLRHCLRFAETFPDFLIVSTLWRQLSRSHLKELKYSSLVTVVTIVTAVSSVTTIPLFPQPIFKTSNPLIFSFPK